MIFENYIYKLGPFWLDWNMLTEFFFSSYELFINYFEKLFTPTVLEFFAKELCVNILRWTGNVLKRQRTSFLTSIYFLFKFFIRFMNFIKIPKALQHSIKMRMESRNKNSSTTHRSVTSRVRFHDENFSWFIFVRKKKNAVHILQHVNIHVILLCISRPGRNENFDFRKNVTFNCSHTDMVNIKRKKIATIRSLLFSFLATGGMTGWARRQIR